MISRSSASIERHFHDPHASNSGVPSSSTLATPRVAPCGFRSLYRAYLPKEALATCSVISRPDALRRL